MTEIRTIEDVMTPSPYAVDGLDDITTARAMMDQHGIRHLAVMHDGRLAGLLSDRELQVTQAVVATGRRDVELPVWAICTRNPYMVEAHEPLDRVAETMANEHFGSVLVVRRGKPAGIVTTTDICRELCSVLRRHGEA